MMFASKTPRDLNHDPTPYRDAGGWRTSSSMSIGVKRFDPRPEFDHVQHNEPNPILVAFRAGDVNEAQVVHMGSALIGAWVGETQILRPHMEHARKVLTRLARLAEVSNA